MPIVAYGSRQSQALLTSDEPVELGPLHDERRCKPDDLDVRVLRDLVPHDV